MPIADITVSIPPGTTSTVAVWPEKQATDNCGPVYLQSRSQAPGSSFSLGTTPVTYVFVDGSGNIATCGFTINVVTEVPGRQLELQLSTILFISDIC